MRASSTEARPPFALAGPGTPVGNGAFPSLALATGRAPIQTAIALACVCAAAGALTLLSSIRSLADQWRSDDLKSIGLLVPFISFGLILRAWRSMRWRNEGSWWGVGLLASLAGLLFLRDQSLLIVTVGNSWLLQLPPLPLIAILYALGLTLTLGGYELLRRSWFPVLLMAAVIPVPQFFSHRVDLPLQHISATVARSFAHLLGEKLTPDHLRLMFTPDFGMFIAPGCNGIRGAVTLGLAALVLSHVYRFRALLFLPLVGGAVLLGYLFNFIRLCLLVVYYRIALPHPWLQDRARGADLILGGFLFAIALYCFYAVADRLRDRSRPPVSPELDTITSQAPGSVISAGIFARVATLVLLALLFGVDSLHAQRIAAAGNARLPSMPTRLGNFRLVRTYQDTLLDGFVVYTWGEYAGPDPAPGVPGPHVALGIAPELDVHDAEVCHIARGEEPTSHREIIMPTMAGDVSLVEATYNNGAVQSLEASTVCDGGQCRQFTHSAGGATLVYAHPHRSLPMQWAPNRPVPILLKVENLQAYLPVGAVEPGMAAQLRTFLAGVNLPQLAAEFR